MTKEDIKQVVLDIIADIAPDEDLSGVKPEDSGAGPDDIPDRDIAFTSASAFVTTASASSSIFCRRAPTIPRRRGGKKSTISSSIARAPASSDSPDSPSRTCSFESPRSCTFGRRIA